MEGAFRNESEDRTTLAAQDLNQPGDARRLAADEDVVGLVPPHTAAHERGQHAKGQCESEDGGGHGHRASVASVGNGGHQGVGRGERRPPVAQDAHGIEATTSRVAGRARRRSVRRD